MAGVRELITKGVNKVRYGTTDSATIEQIKNENISHRNEVREVKNSHSVDIVEANNEYALNSVKSKNAIKLEQEIEHLKKGGNWGKAKSAVSNFFSGVKEHTYTRPRAAAGKYAIIGGLAAAGAACYAMCSRGGSKEQAETNAGPEMDADFSQASYTPPSGTNDVLTADAVMPKVPGLPPTLAGEPLVTDGPKAAQELSRRSGEPSLAQGQPELSSVLKNQVSGDIRPSSLAERVSLQGNAAAPSLSA